MMAERGEVNTRQLEDWLMQRRWYGDKTRRIEHVEPVFRSTVELDEGEVTIEIVRLTYASGRPADYLLVRESNIPDEDGIHSGAVREWLMRGLRDRREIATDRILRWNLIGDSELLEEALQEASHVFGGEQSNSSIVFGDRAIMKLFRRIREGVNPEVEICEFLTRHTRFTAFPRLIGSIDLEHEDAVTTIAAVQAFIPSVGDAWEWVTERIGEAGGRAETTGAARQLGVRTGELHVALASGTTERFVPEMASGAYAAAVLAEARTELKDTISQLEHRGVDGVSELGLTLEASLDALLKLEGTMITRVHGDYHLGQVLRTSDQDFAILDFEGEPTRSLAERRAKASPLRDVAGMLRSFDYAAESARRTGTDQSVEVVTDWYEMARGAFLDGYDSVVREDSVLTRGWETTSRSEVLAALEMHKALYEVRYELNNRPDWLEIPLNALRRIAGTV